MANEFRPLIEILRDLKALALQKASGFFFVVTEDNHSCTIRLRSGQIEDVVFSRHRSDEAVQLLAKVPAELHIYASGGHGYGMRKGDKPHAAWPARCEEWLRDRKLITHTEN